MAYFPAISLADGQQVTFNFGLRPLKMKPNTHSTRLNEYPVNSINEPECLYKNYYRSALTISEIFKRYVFTYFDYEGKVNPDYRLMIGTLLWEYLYPLMLQDPYITEVLIYQFFFDL